MISSRNLAFEDGIKFHQTKGALKVGFCLPALLRHFSITVHSHYRNYWPNHYGNFPTFVFHQWNVSKNYIICINLNVGLQNQISQKRLLHDKMRFLLIIPPVGFGLTTYRSSDSITALTTERFAQSIPVFL